MGSSRHRNVDVQMIFDTALLAERSAASGTAPARAGHAATAAGCAYLISAAAAPPHPEGRHALAARAGDTLRLYATSGSNNFEDAVLIESVQHVGGDPVVEAFHPVSHRRPLIVPGDGEDVLPGVETPGHVWWHAGVIARPGVGEYRLRFAAFVRDDDGQLVLLGHFQLSPAIQITGAPRINEASEVSEANDSNHGKAEIS